MSDKIPAVLSEAHEAFDKATGGAAFWPSQREAYCAGHMQGQRSARRLLIAAKDALRSYQFANSSPELAKEIADALDAELERQGP